ncbi:MAG: prephenate dehydrogenase/arogenate dehydrogenase family protein, partial [Geobacteraceae bacterium]|nr:prephenate dehydrogenase/arogenate dehydrogenase family protein [Geobacteraceae bacterium]
ASSDPVMWRDIAVQNRTAMLEMMDFFAASYAELRSLVAESDAEGLERFFKRSRDHRESIL